MKTIKFAAHLVPLILSGEKTSTWRLFDDKNLSVGDDLSFVNKETSEEFASGKITAVEEKKLGEVTDADFSGHERYKSMEKMYETFRDFYGDRVTPETVVKMIDFEVV